MLDRRGSYEYEDLLACGRGEMFGPGNAAVAVAADADVRSHHRDSETGGEYGKGLMRAELDVKPDLWFFGCHFKGDPVMPGCLGLDALWQMVGFFLGWIGGKGRGRALGLGELKFSGQVLPNVRKVVYNVDIKRVMRSKLVLGIADGWLSTDGEIIYRAKDLKVGLFKQDAAPRLERRRCSAGSVDATSQQQLTARRGDHEAGCHHGDGHRLVHRKQHPGSAASLHEAKSGNHARGEICRTRLPLAGAGRADARSGRRDRSPRDALPRRGRGVESHRDGAGDPGFRAGARATSPTTEPASSWAPADRRRAPSWKPPTSPARKGPKRVGPFAVPKAMSSTASATLATWFKIKGVNYSISSACATSNHCIGNAYRDDPDRQAGHHLRRRLRGTRLVAVGAVRRDGRDVVEIQRHAGDRFAPL